MRVAFEIDRKPCQDFVLSNKKYTGNGHQDRVIGKGAGFRFSNFVPNSQKIKTFAPNEFI